LSPSYREFVEIRLEENALVAFKEIEIPKPTIQQVVLFHIYIYIYIFRVLIWPVETLVQNERGIEQ
jgi:hypothetical protein